MSFLKVWGCAAYVKKLQPDKLEPKAEKCIFVGYPRKIVRYTFYKKIEGKLFVAKTGTFLEEEFLAKGVSGRKIELDEVIEPTLHTSTNTTEHVLEPSSSVIAEQDDTNHNDNDQDHEDHDFHHEAPTKPRRSTRKRTSPQLYGDLIKTIMSNE
jgi:adenylate kinase family enzyme